jgi:hypothetical protein
MTRLWRDGLPLAVWTEGDLPSRFHWQGQAHTVERVTDHWRIDSGWWRFHVWRDYFKLVTRSGLVVVLYRDLDSRRWYVLRLYD